MKNLIFIAIVLSFFANAACVAKRGSQVSSTNSGATAGPAKLVFICPKVANENQLTLTFEKVGSRYNGTLLTTKDLGGDTSEKLFAGVNCAFSREEGVLQAVSCITYDNRPFDGPFASVEVRRQDDGSDAAYAITGGGNIMELSDARLLADRLQTRTRTLYRR